METDKLTQAFPKQLPKTLRNDSSLKQIVSVLKQEFLSKIIFFYGSRAQQTHGKGSDYDFVVVIEESQLPKYKRSESAKKRLFEMGFVTDIFVYTQKEFDEWKNEFSSIPEMAVNTGYEVTNL